jgi:peptide/nickel transport system substrate-binding protein
VFGKLFNTPMRPGASDEIVWDLATGQRLIDPYTVEYTLRDGITFHNGAPFTAEDVKATFEYASQASRPAAWYPGVCEAQVVDRLTVRILTKKGGYPASAFHFLAGFLPILSKDDVKDVKQLQSHPNGTGPFKYVEQKGNASILAAFDKYYLGKPAIQNLQYVYIGDGNTRVLALLSGEADLIDRLTPEQYTTLEKDSRFKVSRTISTENKYLHFRTNKPPFDNQSLRLAVCHAIDRSQILDIMGVAGHPSSNYISPVKFGYLDLANYPKFDPQKCQELLSQAGYPNGNGLPELEYLVSIGFYPKTKEYGELITAMLQEQGFKVKLTVMETAAWEARIYNRAGQEPYGHILDVGWSTGSPEPDLVLRPMFYSKAGSNGGLMNGWKDQETDKTLDAEQGESDVEKRRSLIGAATSTLAAKVPSFSLFTSVLLHAQRANLEGVYLYPNGPIDATKANFKA